MEIVEGIFGNLTLTNDFVRNNASGLGNGGCRLFFCVGLMEKHVLLTCDRATGPGAEVWGKVG